MTEVGFEPTMPAVELTKTVHAIVIGEIKRYSVKFHCFGVKLATSDFELFSLCFFGCILYRKCRVSHGSRQSVLEYELVRPVHSLNIYGTEIRKLCLYHRLHC
jgi:hypothetical protein